MLTIQDLHAAKVGIIGFGKEGQAVARFLHGQGLTATVFDAQSREVVGGDVVSQFESQGFTFYLAMPFGNFDDCTVLFRSPGVPWLSPEIVVARQRGATITSQTQWFFDQCPAPIIGITGTKGKGTTTSLIAHILELAKQQSVVTEMLGADTNVYVTGNIGKQDPFDLLEQLSPRDLVVFELSSFQLQDLRKSPHIGVCLMVTSEHLNHHKDLQESQDAKTAITAFQTPADIAIFSDDYPASQRIGQLGEGKKYCVSRHHSVRNGVYAQEETIKVEGMQQIGSFSVRKRLLRGAHNLENMAAATAVCIAIGILISVIEEGVVSFPGLEDRLEFVGEFGQVKFYNDSISTVPESSIAALHAFPEPKVIILGGSDKGSDFTELGVAVAGANMRGVILIGQMTERIDAVLKAASVTVPVVSGATTMAEIFDQITAMAHAGDVVLLSPACASFGMFKNYKDRGEQFKRAARSFNGKA